MAKNNYFLTLCFSLFILLALQAQKPELSYYLSESSYDSAVPSPEEFLGYQVGEWHVSHDQLKYYMEKLAETSDRVRIETYGYSHEQRPLQLLTITSTKNHARLDDILDKHQRMADGENVDTKDLPAVVYQGYSIHGNESSGSNAALLVAYYLAAGQGKTVMNTLDNLVILLDPCYNPDGLTRFSTWANSNRYKNLVSDPKSREYNEPWPRGRTNHYWFDLNRDWLLLTHPESKGRIKNFQKWNPNVLTDHHEMGSNSTFFFQPGIPSRTNPNTPQINQDLTEEIGHYHAGALDSIGSLYYSKESFDDFYYGKGSTYPDAQGCVGILFEQASSRGHLQETVNGLLSFPFTIRNQVVTSLSTQEAAVRMRSELLKYKGDFFKDAIRRADAHNVKAWIFGDEDTYKLNRFVEILLSHDIEVNSLSQNTNQGGKSFAKEKAYIVSLRQQQFTLAKSVFESVTSFNDSLFYDVSAWTMPLAFDLDYASYTGSVPKNLMGEKLSSKIVNKGNFTNQDASFAYTIPWKQYMAPTALFKMQDAGLNVKIANDAQGQKELITTVQNQKISPKEIQTLMSELSAEYALTITGIDKGTRSGKYYGSPSNAFLEQPKIALISGTGFNSYDVGELWFQLDHVMGLPFTMLDKAQFGSTDLSRYNLIIMADGRSIGRGLDGDKLKKWVQAGGNIIAFKNAINYLNSQGIISVKKIKPKSTGEHPDYKTSSSARGAQVIGGAIFESILDMTHPLSYGYKDKYLPTFKKGTHFYEPTANALATPAKYSSNALLSGYVSDENLSALNNSAAIMVHGHGGGKVISITDNPNFRGYWWGGSKLFANAIFLNELISNSAVQK